MKELDLERGKLSIGNVRLHYYENGVITISKTNREAVAYMDHHYERIPDQMAWRPRCCFNKDRRPAELAPHFNRHAYIVGKGKSADRLTPAHFPTDDPVIGINEAFMFLEGFDFPNMVFGIRQDTATGITMPAKSATMVIPDHILPIYANYPRTYVFNAKKDFGITHACASVIVAMGFAIAMGCDTLTMYGFDGYTVGSVEYGDLGNHRNKMGNNFQILRQKEQLRFLNLEGINVRWVTPDLENYLTEV